MPLETLKVGEFRLLKDIELSISPTVTVLLGANNTGKSGIVDALTFLRDAAAHGSGVAFSRRHGFDRIVARHDVSSRPRIEPVLVNEPSIVFTLHPGEVIAARHEPAAGSGNEWTFQSGNRMVLQEPKFATLNTFLRDLVHVDPFRRAAFQAGIEPTTMIEDTGTNLATVLHYHYNNDRELFDQFEAAVSLVLPEVDIVETPVLAGPQTTVQVRFHGDPLRYDLWQISSGVKDVLTLLAALHFSAPQAFIILEEPENHLHPTAQRALANLIEKIAARDSKQVLLTTHSQTLLGQFPDTDVWFVEKRNGVSTLQRMVETELPLVWSRLGFAAEALLEILGNTRQVLVIVEGRDDMRTFDPLWREYEIDDAVLVRRSEGGGAAEIAQSAAELQRLLTRFGLPLRIFVVLDNDGDREKKVQALQDAGFDDTTSHVWIEKEIDSYLVLPKALEAISGRTKEDVQSAIDAAVGAGKERLRSMLEALGIRDTPANVIVQNALKNDPASVPEELRSVVARVQKLLGRDDRT